MSITFRKPEFVPTIFMLVVVITCLYLAIWQLQRLEEKTQLLATIDAAQSLPPRDILSFSDEELQTSQWRNVIVNGVFDHTHELHATPRYYKTKLGYAILTPLAFETPQGTHYVMVNRGWVDREKKEASTRQSGNTSDKVTVEGAIRISFKQKTFTPNNRPDLNVWLWYDLPAMAKTTGLPLLPILIDATSIKTQNGEVLKDAPRPFPIEIKIRNDHMGYAITWLLVGLTAIGVYGAYYCERRKYLVP